MVIERSPLGALVIVGTPIGNLGDMTPRAIEALSSADTIACEDTRRTGRLLAHFGVTAPKLIVANEHTERLVCADIVDRITAGERVAFVSDAGMPVISDPGGAVVEAVLEATLPVEVVPGPSALDTAIASSGLPSGRFCFEGFLPRRGSERAARIRALAVEPRTTVLYEAPHRLARTLGDLRVACGATRRVAILRELTKLHEEHWRGSLADACTLVAERDPRGEYVLVIAGAEAPSEATDDDIRRALSIERDAGATTRDAVDTVAANLGAAHRRVYALATERS
ncbi:MAG: 16S rRNA (cytidine(1402)-2'-O)-methyltransferase [Actinobacteria bacterium]|nr:16S rRNA (cytidine(1402)-2'-O)-methyltransferase [Actinomycetota bacterium]